MGLFQWMILILFGGLLGALGQSARAIVGFKKLRDLSGDDGSTYSANFSTGRLVTSIFIGFSVGALTALAMPEGTLVEPGKSGAAMSLAKDVDLAVLGALMAAGYAGSDAIEGLANKLLISRQGTSKAP